MRSILKIMAVALVLGMTVSCGGGGGGGSSNIKTFYYKLQGKWESNDAANATYSGTLVIGTDRITITGYGEKQTPFQAVPKGESHERLFGRREILYRERRSYRNHSLHLLGSKRDIATIQARTIFKIHLWQQR